jgi:DNA-binding beta-propeller fold protein YncE
MEAAMKRNIVRVVVFVTMAALGARHTLRGQAAQPQTSEGVPVFEVDPSWPKMEGNFGVKGNWLFGAIGSIAVDPTNDHVWAFTRPETLRSDEDYALKNPTMADCCVPSPSVLEFDPEGNFIQGWGGWGPDDWVSEHGISIDYRGNVWLAGYNRVLKFTRTGKLLLRIGRPEMVADSNEPESLGFPTKALVYPKTNEVFVSDGYVNRRVIVFDADTGKFKRLWGAYGNKPDDAATWIRVFEGPPALQFFVVHDITVSNDGLVYVADRGNNRVQVFNVDGTFVKEAFVAREVRAPSNSVIGVAVSTDDRQQFLYVAGADDHLRILNRDTLQVIGSFGRMGYYPGQSMRLHMCAVDSKGNIYTAMAGNDGRRIQKFVNKSGLSQRPPRS